MNSARLALYADRARQSVPPGNVRHVLATSESPAVICFVVPYVLLS